MLKKSMAVLFCLTMVLSSMQGAFAADYGYSYGEQIVHKTGGVRDQGAGDSVSSRVMAMRGTNTESDTGAFYLYNYNEATGGYSRSTNDKTETYFRLYNAYQNPVSDTSHTFCIDTHTPNYSGKSFFSRSSSQRATLEVRTNTNAVFQKSSTMTYQFKIKYDANFAQTDFLIASASDSLRNIRAFRIQSDGTIASGPNSFTKQNCGRLTVGNEYTFGVVIKFIPTATSGQYSFKKSLYLDGVQIYSIDGGTTVSSLLKYARFEVDCMPWNASDFTYNAETPNITHTDSGTVRYVSAGGTDFSAITTRYELIDTKLTMDDLYVYAGNKYADTKASLNNSDSQFHVTSDIVNNWKVATPDNYNITVEAETAATDSESQPKVIVATYNESGALENVQTGNIALTPGTITDATVTVPSANADKTVAMILDSMGTLKPIAQFINVD